MDSRGTPLCWPTARKIACKPNRSGLCSEPSRSRGSLTQQPTVRLGPSEAECAKASDDRSANPRPHPGPPPCNDPPIVKSATDPSSPFGRSLSHRLLGAPHFPSLTSRSPNPRRAAKRTRQTGNQENPRGIFWPESRMQPKRPEPEGARAGASSGEGREDAPRGGSKKRCHPDSNRG